MFSVILRLGQLTHVCVSELCLLVQAIEAETSYKACIQAANSARDQLDFVKVQTESFV